MATTILTGAAVSSSGTSTGSFGDLHIQSQTSATVIKSDAFGLTIDSDQGWYPLTVTSPYETAARFLSSDGTAAIEIGDNSSTANYNRIQVVGDGRMEFFVNNQEIIKLAPGGSATVFNEDSLDINFRFEGADDENLFYLDAGKNHATIGAARGNTGDEKLLVAGDVGITGSLHVSGNISTSGSIIAKEFRTEFVNQVVTQASGSTTFGDSVDDIHRFTGSIFEFTGSALRVVDNALLGVGSSTDLNISHNGTNATISEGTGNLTIRTLANDKDVIFQSDDGSGGVTSYFYLDGSVTKTIFAQSTQHADNAKATFGAAGDMEIYHDGTNSVINNTTGDLQIYNNLNDKDIVFLTDDGSGGTTAYLTLDGSTTSVNIDQDVKLAATKKLYFDGGTHTYIHEPTDDRLDFIVGSDNLLKLDEANNKVIVPQSRLLVSGSDLWSTGNQGGSTDNVVVLQLGRMIDSPTNPLVRFYADDNLDMIEYSMLRYYGRHYFTRGSAAGGRVPMMTVQGNSTTEFRLWHQDKSHSGGNTTGSAVIYLNASTGSGAISEINSGGGLAIPATNKLYFDGGTHTYISEVGADTLKFFVGGQEMLKLIEGSDDFVHTLDNVYLAVGTGQDLTFHHDGTDSFIGNATGDLTIRNFANDKDIIFQSDDGSGGVTSYLTIDGSSRNINVDIAGYMDIKSADGSEGGISLSKSAVDATHTKYSISHRDDNQSLIIYSYDGTTFRNWFTADEPNAQLKLGANSSNPLIIDDNGDLNVLHLIEHQGDTNTYVQFTTDRLRFAAGGEVLLDLFEGTQDYVLLGDGGDVDINLNGDMFVRGSDGNVGIGTDAPTSLLHIFNGDGSITDDANNHLLVEDDGHSYIGIGGGTSSDVGLHFMDSGGIRGRVAYHHADDSMTFKTANTVQWTMDSSGNVAQTGDMSGSITSTGSFGHITGFNLGTGNVGIDMNNTDIKRINNLQFNDDGPGEGLQWGTWKIFSSPHDLSTNSGGSLQFVSASVGSIYSRTFSVGRPHKINTGATYFRPTGSGNFAIISGSDGAFLMLDSNHSTNDKQVGGIYWNHTQGNADAHIHLAGIATYVENTGTAGLSGGNLLFFTKNAGSNPGVAPRMMINHNGNIGIGVDAPTVSPATRLDIRASGVNGLVINQDEANADISSRLFFKEQNSTIALYNTGDTFSFRTGATIGSTSGTERFRVNTGGIDVIGDLDVSGNSYFNYGLVVNEGSNDADFRVEGNGNANLLRTDAANDRFGIGTGNPTTLLDISGSMNLHGSMTINNEIKRSHIFIKGTGLNQTGGANRVVTIAGHEVCDTTSPRGLRLDVIDGLTHQVVTSSTHDTYGSGAASNALAVTLNSFTSSNCFGVLTSYDAIENAVTLALKHAATNQGLTKLAGISGDNTLGSRHAYAALFHIRGNNVDTGLHHNHDGIIEVLSSNDRDDKNATISTHLTSYFSEPSSSGIEGGHTINALHVPGGDHSPFFVSQSGTMHISGSGRLQFDSTANYPNLVFPANHSADKIRLYAGGNEKIGTEANTIVFTADNFKFKDSAGDTNMTLDSSGQARISGPTDINLVVVSTDSGGGLAIKDSGTSGDYYNGVFCSGNELFLKANNSERLRVESGGNIKITNNLEFGSSNIWQLDQGSWTGGSSNQANIMLTGAAGTFGIHSNTSTADLLVDGNIRSLSDVVAFYSDIRLKHKFEPITSALEKVQSLEGFTYESNELAKELGYNEDYDNLTGKRKVGVSAQQVQEVLPEAVTLAPFDTIKNEDGTIESKSGEDYLTVKYEKLVPLLIESIKELKKEIEELKKQ